MNDISRLTDLLNKKTKLVAMVAPSFPVVYEYPQIVSRLKRLGFSHVVEVSAGAKKTNEEVLRLLQDDPHARFITSPCPSFVRLIRAKHPQLLPYLAFKADSPMIATARIVKEKFPDCSPVFIGPCVAKKLESSEDYPELNILVVTYKELDTVFNAFNIGDDQSDKSDSFEITEQTTRIYPTDGGLTESSGAKKVLKDDEIMVVSGWKNCEAALLEFENNPKIRLLDILFCEGGCINGPGIVSTLSPKERKKRVMDFYARVD